MFRLLLPLRVCSFKSKSQAIQQGLFGGKFDLAFLFTNRPAMSRHRFITPRSSVIATPAGGPPGPRIPLRCLRCPHLPSLSLPPSPVDRRAPDTSLPPACGPSRARALADARGAPRRPGPGPWAAGAGGGDTNPRRRGLPLSGLILHRRRRGGRGDMGVGESWSGSFSVYTQGIATLGIDTLSLPSDRVFLDGPHTPLPPCRPLPPQSP